MRPKIPAESILWLGDFRQILFTDSISQFGTQILTPALPLVTVVSPNDSSLEVGALPAAESPPCLSASVPAGVRADLMHRRPLPATDVARVAPLLWVPVANSAGTVVSNILVVTFRRSITTDRLLVWSTLPLGGVLSAVLGQLLGARTTLWVAGLAAALSFLWIHCSPPRTPRDTSEDYVLGGSLTGTARQEAAGAGKSASVSGARPAGGDRTDSA
ncbi:hypothetical protein OG226_02335 [Streptomyces sp. NBC_01261]|uniref:hypothetical protein n=1 Tax=Streptomyces sp. NBC_01261 TaxID=2903802 RepID=UPI002E36BDAD|nr:hypothetical protein [Streptomyces sp. NBC_01261]